MDVLDLVIIGAIGYFLYERFRGLSNGISASINGVSFDLNRSLSTGFQELFFTIALNVENISGVRLNGQGYHLGVTVNGRTIAIPDSEIPFTIYGSGVTVLQIPVLASLEELLLEAGDLEQLLTEGGTITVTVTGNVLFSIGAYNVNVKGIFPVPKL